MINQLGNQATQNILEKQDKMLRKGMAEMREKSLRAIDMQNVLANKLGMAQQSADNAENYPSTWTTNPDGGNNGQV